MTKKSRTILLVSLVVAIIFAIIVALVTNSIHIQREKEAAVKALNTTLSQVKAGQVDITESLSRDTTATQLQDKPLSTDLTTGQPLSAAARNNLTFYIEKMNYQVSSKDVAVYLNPDGSGEAEIPVKVTQFDKAAYRVQVGQKRLDALGQITDFDTYFQTAGQSTGGISADAAVPLSTATKTLYMDRSGDGTWRLRFNTRTSVELLGIDMTEKDLTSL